ncbi:hemolysin activation/secretion protein, partial [Polynucleobacter sphagniphilus]|nr:hemolysin activation/secretion protein [Polynucleobacter sphagniphilus]
MELRDWLDSKQEALKPFTNRQLTLDQIKEAGDALTNLYAQMGRMAQA